MTKCLPVAKVRHTFHSSSEDSDMCCNVSSVNILVISMELLAWLMFESLGISSAFCLICNWDSGCSYLGDCDCKTLEVLLIISVKYERL